jgi:hypothetical protein
LGIEERGGEGKDGTMSEITQLIPGEIAGDEFYGLLEVAAMLPGVRTILEVGSSCGTGSTKALESGVRRRGGVATLCCVEVSGPRFEALKAHYAGVKHVRCFRGSSVAVEEFPSKEKVEEFYRTEQTKLRKFSLEEVLAWLEQDVEYVRREQVETDVIGRIREELGVKVFDLVLLDGSEFTGEAEWPKVRGAGVVALDDTMTYKNYRVREWLLRDAEYQLVVDAPTVRHGYAIFVRRDHPAARWAWVLRGRLWARVWVGGFLKRLGFYRRKA